jgi:YD repeat-containing protein
VSVTNAVSKTTSFAYDPFGKLIQTTDAVGQRCHQTKRAE